MDAAACRAHFSALRADAGAAQPPWAFLENAGGSRVPDCVADAAAAYFRDAYVQLGAGYAASNAADATVAAARRVAAAMFASDPNAGFPVLGASTSALLDMLSRAVERTLRRGDVLVVSSAGHEANIGPWVRAAAAVGARVAWWHAAGPHGEDTCPLDGLRALLAAATSARERVRLVAFPLASNILGGVTDAAAIAAAARAVGALTVCDGVAFAPHRAVDAPAWGLDFFALSLYKTYGPHMGALYGSHAAWALLRAAGGAPNHVFITKHGLSGDDTSSSSQGGGYGGGGAAADVTGGAPWYAWELGGVCHEACAALAGLRPYLRALAAASAAGAAGDAASSSSSSASAASASHAAADAAADAGDAAAVAAEAAAVRAAFGAMGTLEAQVTHRLASYLEAAHEAGRIRLLGPRLSSSSSMDGDHATSAAAALGGRVPTFSFVPTAPGVTPAAVVAACHVARVACRSGHMYAPRLLRHLNVPTDAALPPDDVAQPAAAAPLPPPAAAAPADGAAPAAAASMIGGAGGVVRVSAVHYNTVEEIERAIAAIDAALR